LPLCGMNHRAMIRETCRQVDVEVDGEVVSHVPDTRPELFMAAAAAVWSDSQAAFTHTACIGGKAIDMICETFERLVEICRRGHPWHS
jgi:hypothetical protein